MKVQLAGQPVGGDGDESPASERAQRVLYRTLGVPGSFGDHAQRRTLEAVLGKETGRFAQDGIGIGGIGQIVVEAVVEDKASKLDVFRRLERKLAPPPGYALRASTSFA